MYLETLVYEIIMNSVFQLFFKTTLPYITASLCTGSLAAHELKSPTSTV
jgi:hypothetical protein